jgi:hypothetical protein
MQPNQRDTRILMMALVIVASILAGAAVGARQTQPLPGFGSGVVPVDVVREAIVSAAQRGEWRVGQQGEWRVGQLGDWRVGVHGTVATQPAAPPFVRVGGVYQLRGASVDMVATVRDLHPSGWARVSDAGRQEHWVNLAVMSSIDVR